MSEETRPRVAVVGSGMTMAAAAMHLLGVQAATMGFEVYYLERDRYDIGLDNVFDRPVNRPRRVPNRRYVTPIAPTTFIHTPKPITKRKARRLRGKASA